MLFDPTHPKFKNTYSLEDEAKESMLIGVKLRGATRQGYVIGSFIGYHLIKAVLWRFGIFAHFFYRTRFMSLPVLAGGIFWNVKKTVNEMKEAGVFEYNKKRVQLEKDLFVVEKVLKSKANMILESQV